MHTRELRLTFVSLLWMGACGPGTPGEPGDTDGTGEGPGTSSTTDTPDPGTTTGAQEPTTGSATHATDPTDGPDPSTGTSTTTGEPVECPEGQAPFSQRWSTVLAAPLGFEQVHHEGGMVVMADGRIAVVVAIRDGDPLLGTGGVMFLSRDGELLGVHAGEFGGNGPSYGMVRTASDELVLANRRFDEEPMHAAIDRFASDGSLLSHTLFSAPTVWRGALGLLGTPVLLGFDESLQETRAVKFKADSAEPEWSVPVAGLPAPEAAWVATSGDGQALLVTQNDDGAGGFARLGLEVVDSEGAVAWARQIAGAAFGRASHAIAVDGGWLVLRTGAWPDGVVQLLAVSAVDGATLWETEVAAPDALGPPLATRVHQIGDALVIPVLRSLAADPGEFSDTRTVAVHRLSLQGAPIDVTPLEDAAEIEGYWDVDSVVGVCDELIVLATGGDRTWVGGYSP